LIPINPVAKTVLVSGFPAELIDADRAAPPDWQLLAKPYSGRELLQSLAEALRQAPRPD
jgi:hypothetical protein